MSIVKSYMYYLIPSVFSALTFFLFLFPLMTRYITLDEFGIRALVHLVIILFEMTCAYGAVWLLQAFFLNFKKDSERRSFLSTLFLYGSSIRFLSFLLFYFYLPSFLSLFIPWSTEYDIFLHISLLARLIKSHEQLMIESWTMDSRSKIFFIYKMLVSLFAIVSTIYFLVIEKLGLLGLFYADLLSSSIALLFLPLYAKNYLSLQISLDHLKSILKVGYPAIPKSMIGKIDKNITSYFLSIFTPIGVLGILYFDHPTIKFIFGLYVFGCLLGWFMWGRHIDKL